MRTLKSLYALLWGSFRSVFGLLIGMVATPFLLKLLGEEAFGSFRVLMDLFGYVGLLEFGLYGSLLTLFVQAYAKKDEAETVKIYQTGIRYYGGVGLLSLAAVLLLWPALDFFVPVSEEMKAHLHIAYWIYAASFFLVPLQASQAALDAQQRSYHAHIATSLYTLSYYLLALLLAWKGLGIQALSLATVTALLISRLYLFWQVRSSFIVGLRKSLNPLDRGTAGRFWRLQWPTFFLNLGGKICLLTDNLVVSVILGPQRVVPFFLTQRVIQIMQTQLQGVANSTWAGLGEIHYEGKRELFNRRLLDITKLIAVLAGMLLVPCIAFNRDFITLWVGEKQFAGTLFTSVAALNCFFLAIFSLWGWCFTAIGAQKDLLAQMTVQAILNLSLNILLTMKMGLIGPILATLISYVLVPLWWIPALLGRHFGISLRELFLSWFWPLLLALTSGFSLVRLRENLPSLSWLGLIFQAGSLFAIYCLFSYLILLSKTEREFYRQRLLKVLSRFKS